MSSLLLSVNSRYHIWVFSENMGTLPHQHEKFWLLFYCSSLMDLGVS